MNTRDNLPPARSDQPQTGGDSGSPRGDHSPRRMIDWRAVAEFLVGSVMIIGGYLFIALMLGLTGGMFGGFVDVLLSFVDERWVGLGRQCGWILGAVVATIGLLLRWVRPDEKKFSFRGAST